MYPIGVQSGTNNSLTGYECNTDSATYLPAPINASYFHILVIIGSDWTQVPAIIFFDCVDAEVNWTQLSARGKNGYTEVGTEDTFGNWRWRNTTWEAKG